MQGSSEALRPDGGLGAPGLQGELRSFPVPGCQGLKEKKGVQDGTRGKRV